MNALNFPLSFYATTFEFTELPTYLDNQLGCGEFVAGLLLTLFAVSIVVIPTIYLTKGKAYSLYIFFGLIVTAPFVGLGWFPVWLYIIIVLAIALGFGQKLADFLGGLKR